MATKIKQARKFDFWLCPELDDAQCYSIIGRTYQSVVDQVKEAYGEETDECGDAITRIEHIEVEYTDMFDFYEKVTGEGGGRGCGKQLENPYAPKS